VGDADFGDFLTSLDTDLFLDKSPFFWVSDLVLEIAVKGFEVNGVLDFVNGFFWESFLVLFRTGSYF